MCGNAELNLQLQRRHQWKLPGALFAPIETAGFIVSRNCDGG
jgi:hypothetical protein